MCVSNYGKLISNFSFKCSKRSVRDVQKQGKICILDVDIKGVYNLKKTDLNPRCIFIRPPSLKVLEQRLRGRGTETGTFYSKHKSTRCISNVVVLIVHFPKSTEEKIKLRLARAIEEITLGNCKTTWHHKIVNDDFRSCSEKSIITLEKELP